VANLGFGDSLFHGRLRAASTHLFWYGLLMAIIGAVALIFPMFATLAAALMVGWVMLLSGALTFAAAFTIHGTGPFFGAVLLGLLSFAAGLFLAFNPFAAAIALTLVLGVIFVFQGAFELLFALEMRPHPGWVGMLISGLASVVMAMLIAIGWPGIGTVVLGILLGVNFLSTGIGYMMVSRALTQR
jgi:uncharacterized membrane protein HdeD (DUF308 family)